MGRLLGGGRDDGLVGRLPVVMSKSQKTNENARKKKKKCQKKQFLGSEKIFCFAEKKKSGSADFEIAKPKIMIFEIRSSNKCKNVVLDVVKSNFVDEISNLYVVP